MSDLIIQLDFKNAPPSQGGGGISDHIPPGRYKLEVAGIDKTTTKTDKPMIVVEFAVAEGEQYAYRRMIERYVIARPKTDDTKIGLQRFHALLVCLGFKEQAGKKSINLANLIGKVCYADVDDEELPETEDYDARLISRPFRFFSEVEVAGEGKKAKKKKAAPKADAEAEEEEEEDADAEEEDEDDNEAEADDDEDEDEDEDEEEESAPEPKKKKSKSKSKGKDKAEEDTLDDLL